MRGGELMKTFDGRRSWRLGPAGRRVQFLLLCACAWNRSLAWLAPWNVDPTIPGVSVLITLRSRENRLPSTNNSKRQIARGRNVFAEKPLITLTPKLVTTDNHPAVPELGLLALVLALIPHA